MSPERPPGWQISCHPRGDTTNGSQYSAHLPSTPFHRRCMGLGLQIAKKNIYLLQKYSPWCEWETGIHCPSLDKGDRCQPLANSLMEPVFSCSEHFKILTWTWEIWSFPIQLGFPDIGCRISAFGVRRLEKYTFLETCGHLFTGKHHFYKKNGRSKVTMVITEWLY